MHVYSIVGRISLSNGLPRVRPADWSIILFVLSACFFASMARFDMLMRTVSPFAVVVLHSRRPAPLACVSEGTMQARVTYFPSGHD